MAKTYKHIPVLLNESIEFLNVKKGGKYVDCNLGGGGHTAEILKRGGTVLGLDVDADAISYCKEKFANEIKDKKLFIVKENFLHVDEAVKSIGWKSEDIDGILYDLGLSMYQFKDAKKGFSFNDDTKLDMRMNEELQVTAEDLIRVLSEKQLANLFYEYGGEVQSRAFAKAIKNFVREKDTKGEEIKAKDVAQLIKNTTKYKSSRVHPATRVFQALRIAVNSELDNLQGSLERAILLLKPGARLVIIAFHSLEDAISKNIEQSPALKLIKTVKPSYEEINRNPSSRSAIMRVYEKTE